MIGALIGGGLSLIGGIANSVTQRKLASEAEAIRNKQASREQAWFDRSYNEDATQRADAVRAMELVRQRVNDRNRAIDGQAAVAGLSVEDAAKARMANNQAVSDAASQINASGAERKDRLDAMHQQFRNQMSELDVQERHRRMQNSADALSNLFSVAGSVAGASFGQ